ncbi:MAG: hypothetical protein IJV83_00190 [Clostridia bacterium]|nr:hypothetical protein [Clostridia bacterium]
MKKTMKKWLTGVLAMVMAFGMVACGGNDASSSSAKNSSSESVGGEESSSSESVGSEESSSSESVGGEESSSSSEEDGDVVEAKNPYKLTMYSFSGGYGRAWLDSLVSRYKKVRAGKEFVVDGVTYDGVEFDITAAKSVMSSMAAAGDTYDIWFQEQVFYNQLVKKGMFADMTEVMTSDNPYEPGVTLESKLTAEQVDYYKRDGKYYGIPHYAGYVGISYNKYMFDANNWYFWDEYDKADLEGNPDNCFVMYPEDKKTAGPDGIYGNEDDGLPTTYAEFYALCEVIKNTNKPISWAGKYRQEYINWFLTALSANNMGLEQMALNYSFDGTAEDLIVFNEDGSIKTDENGNIVTEKLVIDGTVNGYELGRQAGKYYALDFMSTILENGWCIGGTDTTYEQTTAQTDFVKGVTPATNNAAMLIDGCWWEMEAAKSFADMEASKKENYKNRYGWMPLPCVDEAAAQARAAEMQKGNKGFTLTDTHNSLCFIGAGVSDAEYEIAKDFIQFAYTNESLADFSIITDTTKAVQYTMTDAQKAKMSAYGRSLMTMQEKSDIVYTFSKNEFYQLNESSFSEYKKAFSSQIGDATYDVVVDELNKGVSTETYFKGFYAQQKYKWAIEIIKIK